MIGVAIGPPVLQDANPDGPDGINLIPLGIAQDISTETTEREYRSEPGFITTYGLENKRLNISRLVIQDPRKAERLDLPNRAPFGVFLQVRGDDGRPTQGYLSRCACLSIDSYWTSDGTCEASGMVFRYDKMDNVDERRLCFPWSAFEPDPMGIRGLDTGSEPSRTVVDMGRPLAGEKERIVYFDEVGIDWVALREADRAKVPTPDPQPAPAPKRPAPQPLVDDNHPRLVRQGASLDELEQGDEALVARQVRLVPQIEETEEPAAVRAVRSAT